MKNKSKNCVEGEKMIWGSDAVKMRCLSELSENYLNVSKISIRHKGSGLQVFMVNVKFLIWFI